MNRHSKLSHQQALEYLFQLEENESEVSSSDSESYIFMNRLITNINEM